METVYYLILIPMVYGAFAIFIVGAVLQGIRILAGLKSSLDTAIGPAKKPGALGALGETFLLPNVLKSHPVHWAFLAAFHVAFLLLILGHLEIVGEVPLAQTIRH